MPRRDARLDVDGVVAGAGADDERRAAPASRIASVTFVERTTSTSAFVDASASASAASLRSGW